MDALLIAEVDVLKILGIHFDRKFTWNYMIDQLATRSRQRLGVVCRVGDYLGQRGLVTAFKSFVRPACEYSNIVFMGASATHLHKLDLVQKMAERLCNTTFPSLASRRDAGSISLLCKLLDSYQTSYCVGTVFDTVKKKIACCTNCSQRIINLLCTDCSSKYLYCTNL